MKRFLFLALVLALLVVPPAAAWNPGTHAYVVDHLGKVPPMMGQEMYGATAPDMFQLDLALNADPLVFGTTHGAPGYELFMNLRDLAHGPFQRAFAFGWISHNDVWGADSTAHDPLAGYVIQKAHMLDAGLEQAGVWAMVEQQLGVPLSADERLLFCHFSVEYAGDLVLRQADSRIGERVAASALLRSADVPELLARALPGIDPAAVTRIEDRYRRYMLVYGGMLMQDDDDAARLLALDMTRFLVVYLQYAYPDLPVDALRPMLEQLSLLGISESIPLVAPDYGLAVQQTIETVRAGTDSHDVRE